MHTVFQYIEIFVRDFPQEEEAQAGFVSFVDERLDHSRMPKRKKKDHAEALKPAKRRKGESKCSPNLQLKFGPPFATSATSAVQPSKGINFTSNLAIQAE